MIRTILSAGAAVAALVATPSVAATYAIGGDFGSSVFKYGTVIGNTFSQFNAANCNDIGVAGPCYRGTDAYQVAFQSGSQLLLHPGPNAGQNTFVLFTAPTAGLYKFQGAFNSAGTGDGVSLFGLDGTLTSLGGINPASPTLAYNFSQFLTAGQQIGLGVERGPVDYFGDSTFLSGSISVPEPAQWALMLGGFVLMGAAMRRRTRVNVVYA